MLRALLVSTIALILSALAVPAQAQNNGPPTMLMVLVEDDRGKPVNISWTKDGTGPTFPHAGGGPQCHNYHERQATMSSGGFTYCAPFRLVQVDGKPTDITFRDHPKTTSFRVFIPASLHPTVTVVFPEKVWISGEDTPRMVRQNTFEIQHKAGSRPVIKLVLAPDRTATVRVVHRTTARAPSRFSTGSRPTLGTLRLTRQGTDEITRVDPKEFTHKLMPGTYTLGWDGASKRIKCTASSLPESVVIEDVCTDAVGNWSDECQCLPGEEMVVKIDGDQLTSQRMQTNTPEQVFGRSYSIKFDDKHVKIGDLLIIKPDGRHKIEIVDFQ